jgi:ribosomal protein S13
MKNNQKISQKLIEIADLISVKGLKSQKESFRRNAYLKAAKTLQEIDVDILEIYQKKGTKGITEIKGIGKSIAEKIEEFLEKKKIEYLEQLEQETAIRQVITHYFQTKNISLDQLKKSARKKDIVYSRYTKPAKQLIELAGSVQKAQKAISVVADWANSRKLDYSIETVFKKWLELDRLKPKEVVKKPFYNNNPLVWSEAKKKWFVVDQTNTWLEFADDEKEIEWRIIK